MNFLVPQEAVTHVELVTSGNNLVGQSVPIRGFCLVRGMMELVVFSGHWPARDKLSPPYLHSICQAA